MIRRLPSLGASLLRHLLKASLSLLFRTFDRRRRHHRRSSSLLSKLMMMTMARQTGRQAGGGWQGTRTSLQFIRLRIQTPIR